MIFSKVWDKAALSANIKADFVAIFPNNLGPSLQSLVQLDTSVEYLVPNLLSINAHRCVETPDNVSDGNP